LFAGGFEVKRSCIWKTILATAIFSYLFNIGIAMGGNPDVLAFVKQENGKLWNLSAKDFTQTCGGEKLYKWNSSKHQQLRYYAKNQAQKLTFSGHGIYEALIDFKDGKLERIYLSLYNRGDAERQLDRKSFEDLLDEIENNIKTLTGTKLEEKKENIGGASLKEKTWNGKDFSLELKWSTSGYNRKTFAGEFISIYIVPPSANSEESGLKVTKNIQGNLASKVIIAKNGDHYLDVPMVDQGQKGYCVAAAAERVMKYYGSEADQHIFAQISKTSAENGTDIRILVKAMRKVGVSLGATIKDLYLNKDFTSESDFQKMISKYNQMAKKEKKDKIRLDDYAINFGEYRFYNYGAMCKAINPEVYTKLRTVKSKSDYNRFQDNVKSYIDKGNPVLWGVMLGIIKEEKLPQVLGGHMRLINGYNEKDDTIVYTDTWGQGHEHKKMSWKNAWAMTTFAAVYLPKK